MGFEGQGDEFAPLMEHVARDLMGEPNKALSRPDELRFGTKGAICVIPSKGVYHDWHDDSGGGVLKFVETYGMMARPQALDYLRGFGLAKQEGRATQVDDKPKRKIEAKYDYVDEHGELLFQVVRFTDGAPRFLQRRPDPENVDNWIWSTKDVRKIPYRLPDIQDAIARGVPVWVVEGEKDVDNLFKLQIPATCNPGGAGKWPDACTEALKGAKLVLCGDNDDAGRKHVELIASKMAGVAASLVIVTLPGLPEKGDISDWIAARPDDPAGALLREYDRQIRERADAPAPKEGAFTFVSYADITEASIKESWWIKGFIPCEAIGILSAHSQAGKSFIALDMALKIAEGVPWFGHRVKRGAVFYQAGEGQAGIRKRIVGYKKANPEKSQELPFEFIPDPINLCSSDATKTFIAAIKARANHFTVPLALIVIDTFAAATAGADENKAEHMTAILANCQMIQMETGASVMLVHHLNAEGNKTRGHTSLPAGADFAISLTIDLTSEEKSKRRELKVTKQKDGETGITHEFILRPLVVAVDEYGEDITTCTISPLEPGTKKTSERAQPNANDDALWRLRDEISANPKNLGSSDGCELGAWRARFYGGKPNDARRQAFNRARTALIEAGLIDVTGPSNSDHVWITDAGWDKIGGF